MFQLVDQNDLPHLLRELAVDGDASLPAVIEEDPLNTPLNDPIGSKRSIMPIILFLKS
jgi:hypothetical protein